MRLYTFGGPVSYEAKLYTSIFALCLPHWAAFISIPLVVHY